jgi:hypothetical protein
MNEEYEVKMSPLSKEYSEDGKTVQIYIYENSEGGWILEVTDIYKNSSVWDDNFDTDKDALNEFLRTIKEEGIESLIGVDSPTGIDPKSLH